MTTIPDSPMLPHAQAAQSLLLQLRQIAQLVQGFTHVTSERRRRIGVVSAIPDEFLHAVSVACDAHPRLAAASEVTGAEFRDTIHFAREYLSVAEELEILARGLRGTVAERRHESAQKALRVYITAKRINHLERRETLIPHLAEMKRALGRTGLRRAKPPEPPPPASEPPS